MICVVRLSVSRLVGLLRGFWSGDLVFIVLKVTVGVVAILGVFTVSRFIVREILKFCLCKIPEENL